jgi:hypothetical protein
MKPANSSGRKLHRSDLLAWLWPLWVAIFLLFSSNGATVAKDDFTIDATTDWGKLNKYDLKPYRLILWLNDFPQTPGQRAAFEKYMERGGAWLGFHVAGDNDKTTNWPWFVDFMGGAVFYTNNWPPLPAKLTVDDRVHPVTKGMPLLRSRERVVLLEAQSAP